MTHILEETGFRYDKATVRLHWATAVLVVVLWVMGRTLPLMPRGPLRVDLWSVHVILGFTLALVLIARLWWRLTSNAPRPASEPGALGVAARAMHTLLYLLLIAVVVLGVLNVLGHGFPMFGVWKFPRIGDDAFKLTINKRHELVANILAGAVLLHACAALGHHYLLRDGVLTRMAPAFAKRERSLSR